MEDIIAAFADPLFSRRFRAHSLKNSLKNIYTLNVVF